MPDDSKQFDNKQMQGRTINDQNNNVMRQRRMDIDADVKVDSKTDATDDSAKRLTGIEIKTIDPLRPQKPNQSTGANQEELAKSEIKQQQCGCIQIPIEHAEFVEDDIRMAHDVSSLKSPCFSLSWFWVSF